MFYFSKVIFLQDARNKPTARTGLRMCVWCVSTDRKCHMLALHVNFLAMSPTTRTTSCHVMENMEPRVHIHKGKSKRNCETLQTKKWVCHAVHMDDFMMSDNNSVDDSIFHVLKVATITNENSQSLP